MWSHLNRRLSERSLAMRQRIRFLLGVVPLVVIGLGLSLYWSGLLRRAIRPGTSFGPSIAFPSQITFGDREIGEIAAAEITFRNDGDKELLVEDIVTSCSCAGLEQEQAGELVRLVRLAVGPGAEQRCVVRLAVRGVPVGSQMVTAIRFRTNDAARPEGIIALVVPRVTGGVHTVPNSVVVGQVQVGAHVRHVVDIWDDALTPRRVAAVTSSNPELAAVKLVSLERSEGTAQDPRGRVIGRAEVNIDTSRPAVVEAWLTIQLVGRERRPESVKVVGAVVGPVEISPSVVVLPRRSADGRIYETTCICRSTQGDAFAMEVLAPPEGLVAEMVGGREVSPTQVIRVRAIPRDGSWSGEIQFVVRFADGRLSRLRLPVKVLGERGSE